MKRCTVLLCDNAHHAKELCVTHYGRKLRHGTTTKPLPRKGSHGMHGTKLYGQWGHMKDRCMNTNNSSYKWYGGKGITVCNEWKAFIPFYTWALANNWVSGLTLDRIDSSKGYCPENCQWLSMAENSSKSWKDRRDRD